MGTCSSLLFVRSSFAQGHFFNLTKIDKMTKAQFRKKTKALKRDISKLIDNRIEKAISSGAINFDQYEDNYLLPKIFLSAVGFEIEYQFRPLTKEGIKNRNKLKLHL